MSMLCEHDITCCLQQEVHFSGFLRRSQSERLIATRITASFNVGNLSVGLVYPNIFWQIKQISLKRAFSLHKKQDCSQRSGELRQCSIEFVCLFVRDLHFIYQRFLKKIRNGYLFIMMVNFFLRKSQYFIVVKARAI